MEKINKIVQKYFKDSEIEFEPMQDNSYRFWLEGEDEVGPPPFSVTNNMDEDEFEGPNPLETIEGIITFSSFGENKYLFFFSFIIDIEIAPAILPEFYKLMNLVNLKLAGSYVVYAGHFEDDNLLLRTALVLNEKEITSEKINECVQNLFSSFILAFTVITLFTESLMSAEETIEDFEQIIMDNFGGQILSPN